MSDLFVYLQSLMTQRAGLFEPLGMTLFRAFAIIIICWFGIKVALGHSHDALPRFASMLLTVAFGLAMIKFYSVPIPLFGRSFFHLIVDQGADMANTLNHSMVSEIWTRLNSIYWGLDTPGISSVIAPLEVIRWLITILAVMAAEIAVFGVIAYGYIAASVAILLGPAFVPFFIVPDLQWIFWGWFKALIQYSFYGVVANATVFVLGSLLIHLIDSHPPPYDGATLAALFLPLVMTLVSFAYGVVKVPSLTNSLFTGKSGESAFPSF